MSSRCGVRLCVCLCKTVCVCVCVYVCEFFFHVSEFVSVCEFVFFSFLSFSSSTVKPHYSVTLYKADFVKDKSFFFSIDFTSIRHKSIV